MANVLEFTDSNFPDEVLSASEPVLVDFWAPWCGPCRQITPMIEELSTEHEDAVKVGKLNIDDNPASAQKYGVSSIPTLMLFKGGEVVERFVGVQPKVRLQEALKSHSNLA
jgi:thioredoxin 1